MENNPQESAEGGGDDNDEYTKTVALSGIGNNNAEMKTELLSDISREATTIDAEAETVPAAPADNEGDTQQIKTADIPELDSEVKTRNLSAEKTIALDTGETLARDAAKTLALDTEETLAEAIHREEHKIYPRAIQLFVEGRLDVEGRKVKIR